MVLCCSMLRHVCVAVLHCVLPCVCCSMLLCALQCVAVCVLQCVNEGGGYRALLARCL